MNTLPKNKKIKKTDEKRSNDYSTKNYFVENHGDFPKSVQDRMNSIRLNDINDFQKIRARSLPETICETSFFGLTGLLGKGKSCLFLFSLKAEKWIVLIKTLLLQKFQLYFVLMIRVIHCKLDFSDSDHFAFSMSEVKRCKTSASVLLEVGLNSDWIKPSFLEDTYTWLR
jgi:hypothetical protein